MWTWAPGGGGGRAHVECRTEGNEGVVEWWRKHLSGMQQVKKMSIVVTDIEGYSGGFLSAREGGRKRNL